MPLPKSKKPGTIIKALMREDPHHQKRSHKQMVAIALSQARKAGAKIPMSKRSNKAMKKASFNKKY